MMVVVVAVWKKDTPMLKKINHSQNLMWRKRKRTSSKLTYDDDDNIALFCDELQRSSDHRLIHLSHLIVYYPLVCSIDKRWCQCNRLSLERKRLWFSFSPVQQKFTHQKNQTFYPIIDRWKPICKCWLLTSFHSPFISLNFFAIFHSKININAFEANKTSSIFNELLEIFQ